MRRRYITILSVIASISVAITILSRHHLRDLSEIARTYSGFYTYLHNHPEIIYRWPQPDDSHFAFIRGPNPQVPPILHQISLREGWKSTLDRYRDALTSCRTLHPTWTHHIWMDENSTSFILEHYPALYGSYSNYKQSIQRANILRYALLHHYGGIYLDLDVTCLESLDDLLHLPWLTPGAYPAGVNNAFILSRPHHPFLSELLGRVNAHNLKWGMPYVENMLSTGCMFFSNRWMEYVRRLARSSGSTPFEDRLYLLADENGDLDPHMLRGKVITPLFAHGGASSWHGWDAAFIVFVGKHYRVIFILAVVVLVVAAVGILTVARSRSAWRRDFDPLWPTGRNMEKRYDDEEL